MTAEIELANFISGVEDQMYRIKARTVTKDKLYYGAKIGPENGFECIRSDNKARAYFNADNFVMQSGDGTGNNWTNKLYFDPSTGQYTFDGKITLTSLAKTLVSLFKDTRGGKLELYDNSQNAEAEIGVASEAGDNTGGVIILYNNGKTNPRIAIGVLEDDDGGIIQALDSAAQPRVELRGYHSGYGGPVMGIRRASGSLATYFRESEGYIDNEKVATEDYVNAEISDAIAAHEVEYHTP